MVSVVKKGRHHYKN